METIGRILETLTKYGIFEIFFGFGILAYIREKFRKKSIKSIDGIEVIPEILIEDELFRITVRNNSKDPLYLYRARFFPGYYSNKIENPSLSTRILSLFWITWMNDKFPSIDGQRNTQGEYLLLGITKKEEEEIDNIFLHPREEVEYPLCIDPTEEDKNQTKKYWNKLLKDNKCGVLRAHFVHGTNSGLLEAQI